MATQLLRVQDSVYIDVKSLSEETGFPMSDIVSKAIAEYKKSLFFDELDVAFAKLKNNKKAWEEEQKERQQTNGTLMDGLDDE